MEKKIEQVKKVLTSSKVSVLVSVINCDNGQMKQAEDSFFGIIKNNDAEKLAAEIDALYSDPPSPERVCPECKGTGYRKGYDPKDSVVIPTKLEDLACPKCHGTGLTPFQRGMNDTPACIENRDCPECFGTGKVPSSEMVCPTCQGKGYTFPGTNEQYDGVIYCRTCNGTGKVSSPDQRSYKGDIKRLVGLVSK